MKKITITLSDEQYAGLQYIAVDPVEFLKNFVHERARLAMETIKGIALQHIFLNGLPMPTSESELVVKAFEFGAVRTAADVQAEIEEIERLELEAMAERERQGQLENDLVNDPNPVIE